MTCYGTRKAFTFMCAETPTLNVWSWNECIARFAIESTNSLHIKIPTGISMFFASLSKPTMTQLTRRKAWRPCESPIRTCSRYGRGWGPERGGVRSRRENEFSHGAACAHQQGKDAVCQGSRTEFQQREI